MPYILISPLFLCAATGAFSLRHPRRGAAFLVVALSTGAIWYHLTSHRHEPRPGAVSTRVVCWNAGRIRGDYELALRRLLASKPDLVGVVEAGDLSNLGDPAIRPPWLAGYQIQNVGGGMLVLALGEIEQESYQDGGTRNRFATFRVDLESGPISCLLVDLDSNPFLSRRTALLPAEEIVMASPTPPTLIMGDFNTPPDSVWFRTIRKTYVNAFEQAGTGIHATWPSYLPFLAIDHIWVHRSVGLGSARHIRLFDSDHCAVLTDLVLEAQQRRGPIGLPRRTIRSDQKY